MSYRYLTHTIHLPTNQRNRRAYNGSCLAENTCDRRSLHSIFAGAPCGEARVHTYYLNSLPKVLLLISYVLAAPLLGSDKTIEGGIVSSQEKLQLQLDKSTYAGGEIAQGAVIFRVPEGTSCQSLTVAIGWETRGKGTAESWYSEPLKLNCGVAPGAGGRYVFKLQVPNGPLSYDGTILSVDWFVKADANLKLHQDLSAKVPITLATVKPGEQYIYGLGWDTEGGSARNVPLRFSSDGKGMATRDFNYDKVPFLYKLLAAGVVFIIVGGLGGNKLPKLDPLWTLLLIAGIVVIASGVYGLIVRRSIRSWQTTSPSYIQQGSATLPVSVNMTAAKHTTLTRIEARVRGREHSRTRHHDSMSRDHVIYEGESVVIAQNQPLMPDAPATFRANLAVPPKAACSFQSNYNSIDWGFTLRISMPGTPDTEEEFTFLMMP